MNRFPRWSRQGDSHAASASRIPAPFVRLASPVLSWSVGDAAETRFHRVTLIILRARQLRDGAAARVERRGRKDLAVAAAEVRGGHVAWERPEVALER